jgi:arabinose-5-phosphate isomerase
VSAAKPQGKRSAPAAEGCGKALASARRVFDIEIEALNAVAARLDKAFERAVDTIFACKGRLVVTGVGKSGLVCRKMAATFASTGTSSFFLHAAEASHGDLGMFARGDVCLAVSNSGKTHELVSVLPSVRRLEIPVIAITGNANSPLARDADIVLDVAVPQEACPLGLAPTASTTATMAIGDALAVAVLERRGFTEQEFAQLHPGGSLGAQLLRVSELMSAHGSVPTVTRERSMRDALDVMTRGGLGVVAVIDGDGALAGVITDGDVRRAALRHGSFEKLTVGDVMTTSPKTIAAGALAAEALGIMESRAITALFIVDPQTRQPLGIVHLHDLLKAGVA